AKEQYEKEIAKRLGVSESAVRATAARAPKVPSTPTPVTNTRPADAPNRIKQAYGLLLWQESLKKPVLDTDTFSRELEGAVGKEVMDEMRRMPLADKETLRFFSE